MLFGRRDHGGLSNLEIPAVDAQQSAAFYENVLDWSIRQRESNNPRFEDATGHLIGRWVTDRVVWWEPGLLPYILSIASATPWSESRRTAARLSRRHTLKETCGSRRSAILRAT